MTNTISFASLVVRDITSIATPKFGQWSWAAEELDASENAIDFSQLVFDARPDKGDGGEAQKTALSDAFVDAAKFLVGGSNHIQHREFFAVVADRAYGDPDFGFDGDGQIFKLSDSGYGGRVTSLAAQNDAADPVTITAHGRVSNSTIGDLTGAVGFDQIGGFGLDNGPESGGRWVNSGDALDFALTGGGLLKSVSFTVDARTATRIAFDVDGAILESTKTGAGIFMVSAEAGDAVTLDYDSKTLFVGGELVTGTETLFDALIANRGNITIGAPAVEGSGYSIRNLALEKDDRPTSERTVDFDDIDINGADDADGGAGGERTMPATYAGFEWKQAGVYAPPNAVTYAAASGPNIGFIAEAGNSSQSLTGYPEDAGSPVVITRSGDDFDFLSGKFSAHSRSDMAITVGAFDNGVLVGQLTYEVDQGGPTPLQFAGADAAQRFTGVDELRFNANDNSDGTADYFGFDDLAFLI